MRKKHQNSLWCFAGLLRTKTEIYLTAVIESNIKVTSHTRVNLIRILTVQNPLPNGPKRFRIISSGTPATLNIIPIQQDDTLSWLVKDLQNKNIKLLRPNIIFFCGFSGIRHL